MKNRPLLQQSIFPYKAKAASEDRERCALACRDVSAAFERLVQQAEKGTFPFLLTPFEGEDIHTLQHVVSRLQRYERVIVIGASLAARAMAAPFQSWVRTRGSFPELLFLAGLDPDIFWEVIALVSPNNTGVLILSSSGEDEIVILQLMRCVEYWNGLLSRKELSERFFVVTRPGPSQLRALAEHMGFSCLDHPTTISDRFSCFSPLALLPAMIVGMDAKKFRQGAALTCNQVFWHQLRIPLEGAAFMIAQLRRTPKTVHVLWPYGDGFFSLAAWAHTLWSGSCGKRGESITGIALYGAMDPRASPFFFGGAKDKVVTFLEEIQVVREKVSPELWKSVPELRLLSHRTMADVVHAACSSACDLFVQKGHPARIIRIQTLNEETLGALMMNFILETLLVSEVLGADPLEQSYADHTRNFV